MDVIVNAANIPDNSWDEMSNLSNGYPVRYIVENYDAEHVVGSWKTNYYRQFKFSQEKYVEFCLKWL